MQFLTEFMKKIVYSILGPRKKLSWLICWKEKTCCVINFVKRDSNKLFSNSSEIICPKYKYLTASETWGHQKLTTECSVRVGYEKGLTDIISILLFFCNFHFCSISIRCFSDAFTIYMLAIKKGNNTYLKFFSWICWRNQQKITNKSWIKIATSSCQKVM